MPFSVCAIAADADLSRVDFASLPQQTLMEMIVDELPDKTKFCDNDGIFLDIRDWNHVDLNDIGEVVNVQWRGFDTKYFPHGGKVNLRWMPSTVEIFALTGSAVTGTVDLPGIPRGFLRLYLQRNRLNGTLNLTDLPVKLVALILHTNEFDGTIELTDLPVDLKFLEIYKNRLSGMVKASRIPKVVRIRLCDNMIDGIVDTEGNPLSHAQIAY